MPPLLSIVLWNTLVGSGLVLLVGLAGHGRWLRQRPAVMHLLWLLVLARFVVPGWIPLPLLPPASATVDSGTAAEVKVSDAGPVDGRVAPNKGATAPGSAPALGNAEPASVRSNRPSAMDSANGELLFLGLSGFVSIGLILWSLVRTVRFQRWLERASVSDERLERLAEAGRRQMGMANRPGMRRFACGGVPFLWAGATRSCVYVPEAIMDSFDDEALTGILCHEMAHHARGDVWPRLFASVVAAIYWWNPLVWWAGRQLSNCQELCCDALVLGAGRPRRAYAESLLQTLDLATGTVRVPGLLASGWGEGGQRSLQSRFRLIGDAAVTPRLPAGVTWVAAGIGVILLCVPVRGDAVQKGESRPPALPRATAQKVPAPLVEEPLTNTIAAADAAPAQQTVKIVGRVVDPTGQPLEGMQIVAAVLPGPPKRAPKPGRTMEWKPEGEPPLTATTDADGRFTFDAADPGSTILVQFDGYERLPPREWKPKGSVGTTISLTPKKEERDNELGYVPRTITTNERRVDGRTVRDVAITWAPTRVIVRWGQAATVDRWKEARTRAEANDPNWKEGLEQSDETTWIVPPGEYMRREATVRIDRSPDLKAETSFGEGLHAGSEKEIILFFGAAATRTKEPEKP